MAGKRKADEGLPPSPSTTPAKRRRTHGVAPPRITGGGRPRDLQFEETKHDGGEPPEKYVGGSETMPSFHGPTPWRYRDEVLSGALEIGNISLIQNMTLLQRIIHKDVFTPQKRWERQQLFGPWRPEDHVEGPANFDEESQFLSPNPPLQLEEAHKTWAKEVGGKEEWLLSDLSPIVYHGIFRALVDRDDCDVQIIGREWFMNDPFKIALIQARPEHFKYYFHGIEGDSDELPDFPIQPLRRPEKRFWVFFMHNGASSMDWSEYLRVRFTVAGDEDPERQWRIDLKIGDEWSYKLVRKQLSKLGVNMDGLHYCIEDESFRFNILGVSPEKCKVYYRLANNDDVVILRYKLQVLVHEARDHVNVVVGPLPEGARSEESDLIGIPELNKGDSLPEGNHFWLAILDTQSGELFDHDSMGHSSHKVLTDNLRRNINHLYAHYDLHLPEVAAVRNAKRYRQKNSVDCGFIALNIMLQFIICRIGSSEKPPNGPLGERNPAAQLYTPNTFGSERGGAIDFRWALSSLAHIWHRREKTGQLSRSPIAGGNVDEDELTAAVTDKKYFKIPSRAWCLGSGQEWLKVDKKERPFDQVCRLDYSRLAKKMEAAMGMTLGVVDQALGHRAQLEHIRYNLEHAGGVLFSFKRPPEWSSVAQQECPVREQCQHLMDIIPIPLNCKVILQPYDLEPGYSAASVEYLSRARANNLLLRNDKVMIGHCPSGFYAQVNSGMHNVRSTLEFNGYPLATGTTQTPETFRTLRLPDVGYFQVGNTFWGFVSRRLEDGIPQELLAVETQLITSCREFDMLTSRYLSLHGTEGALRAWKSLGGRIYPTMHTKDVKNPHPESVGWPVVAEDHNLELEPQTRTESKTSKRLREPKKPTEAQNGSDSRGHPPKAQEPKKVTGSGVASSRISSSGGGIEAIREIPGCFRGLPATLAPRSTKYRPVEAPEWDIDRSSEARRLRVDRYREAAERTWNRHLGKRRRIERCTPEYNSEDSIDHALDKHIKSGVRPRKKPRRDPDTKAVIYEFSSSDDGEVRKRKRKKLAGILRGSDHPAVCRDIDVMGVVNPEHPLRFFSTLTSDRTPPPGSAPNCGAGGKPRSPLPSKQAPPPRKPVREPKEKSVENKKPEQQPAKQPDKAQKKEPPKQPKPVKRAEKPPGKQLQKASVKQSKKSSEPEPKIPIQESMSAGEFTRIKVPVKRPLKSPKLKPEEKPEPRLEAKLISKSDTGSEATPEPKPEPEMSPEWQPEGTPEPETESSQLPTPSPKVKHPRKLPRSPKRPPETPKKVQEKEDLSEKAFKAAKAAGRNFCCACGTSLRAMGVAVATKNHGPDSLCGIRNWNHLVAEKTEEMEARKKRFATLRKKGITTMRDIPEGDPDYSPPYKPASIPVSDDEQSGSESEYEPPQREEQPVKKPLPENEAPVGLPPSEESVEKDPPKEDDPVNFPADGALSETVFKATRGGKNARKFCPHCGTNLGAQAYMAAMTNHGPGTVCDVADWRTLAVKATPEMKERKKALDKSKRQNKK